jgi:5-methylcytosine-specific restriction endonuclease McrA
VEALGEFLGALVGLAILIFVLLLVGEFLSYVKKKTKKHVVNPLVQAPQRRRNLKAQQERRLVREGRRLRREEVHARQAPKEILNYPHRRTSRKARGVGLNLALRVDVIKRDKHTCQRCLQKAPDVQIFVVPVAPGDPDARAFEPSKLWVLCAGCVPGMRPQVLKEKPQLPTNASPRGNYEGMENDLLREYDSTCQYCGRRGGELQIDHKCPESKGGTTTFANLWILCVDCNQGKSNRYID